MSAATQPAEVPCDKAHAMLLSCVQQQRLSRQDAFTMLPGQSLPRQKTGIMKASRRTRCSRCRSIRRTAAGAQPTNLSDAPGPRVCVAFSL